MAIAYLVGSDGTASIAGGFGIRINAWRGNATRPVSDVSAYGDTGRRRRLGSLQDFQGSFAGTFAYDAASTSPLINHTSRDGSLVTLGCKSGVTNVTYTMTAAVSSQSFDSKVDGDLTGGMDFMLSGGLAPVESWDES